MCIELIKGAVIEVFIFLKGLFTNYTLGEGGGVPRNHKINRSGHRDRKIDSN